MSRVALILGICIIGIAIAIPEDEIVPENESLVEVVAEEAPKTAKAPKTATKKTIKKDESHLVKQGLSPLSKEDIDKMDMKACLSELDHRKYYDRTTSAKLMDRMNAINLAAGIKNEKPKAEAVIQSQMANYKSKKDPLYRGCKLMFAEVNPSNKDLTKTFGADAVKDKKTFDQGMASLKKVCKKYEAAGKPGGRDPTKKSKYPAPGGEPVPHDRLTCNHLVRVFGVHYHAGAPEYRKDND